MQNDMRNRLVELLKQKIYPRIGVDPAEVVADYLLDNGVIVPPCKVGDTVYEIQSMRNRIQAYTVKAIRISVVGVSYEWSLMDGEGCYLNVTGFRDIDIGKTVFLTREEAEQAIKEREQNA